MSNEEIIITRHGKEIARVSPVQPRSATTTAGKPELTCSFCGKLQAEVAKLIAGPEVF